jgi:O-antigen ligase
MIRRSAEKDYETVTRSRRVGPKSLASSESVSANPSLLESLSLSKVEAKSSFEPQTVLKPGHALSFAMLFLFTIILYTRPAEFYPSAITNYVALTVGMMTLALFAITQLAVERALSARPREVHLVLLFMMTALLSIPLAIDPAIAWGEFSATYIRGILIFVVIINVVRTERRLKALLFVAVVTAIVLSVEAVNDYRLGLMTIEGYRASGRGTGIFGNTNDMALHLVTMLPISIALFFGSRNPVMKVIHAACSLVMMSGILLSYSRGAFLGMFVILIYFAFRIAKSNRIAVVFAIIAGAAAIILLAPSGYGTRLLSIFVPGLDPGGSADSRRGELLRSAYVAFRHPLLGIGMGNYQPLMSLKGLVTHNSYTQVAAEMGMTALVLYTMFILSPFRKLSVIARETFAARQNSRFYYLALGLQASLLAYIISSFFLSVAYSWYVYYLVGYAVCFRRMYESETGRVVRIESRKHRSENQSSPAIIDREPRAITA